MRFMRARNFHFEKTLLMLRNCLAWRRANDVDNGAKRAEAEAAACSRARARCSLARPRAREAGRSGGEAAAAQAAAVASLGPCAGWLT
jgi:hypothetical protein